jgi:hypothetical protein
MDQKIFVLLGFLAISFIFLSAALGLPSSIIPAPIRILLLLFSLIFDVVAFASRRYAYIMLPILRQHKKKIVLSDSEPYSLSTSEDAIIKMEKGEYIATVYISIPIYRSATEMGEAEKIEFSRQVSKLVGISSDPIRFTAEMYMMNKDAYIQTLRDAINIAETEEAQMMQTGKDAERIEVVRGKLAMWRNILQSSSSAQSMELVSYASISAYGSKEYEALSMAQQKAREAISGIGATFGVTPSIITGKEILKFVEPEYLIPFSTVSEEIEEKTEEEVI